MTKLTRSKMLLKLFVVLALFVASTFADNDPNCGTKGPKPSQRIVGGVNAEPLEFPWQGSLRYFSPTAGWYHTCGCSLINKRWVLTASHCVNRSGVVDPTKYRFVGGEHDRSINEGKEVEVGITDIFVSPLWDPDRIDGDASLLKLERDLKLDDEEKHLGTVCIPDVEDLDKHAGKTCIATGWGNTAWQGTSPNILQKVEVKIIDQATCASRYAIVNPISSRMLCFGEK
ncbi:hypothetical protein RDWZM_009446 [Blomia tropicalis]|uniref:Peptidase S1 domain-containing protein n=1 Tax=Blomia tropicalis TaxID=40697 RepID=A0A9Q0RL09_BLOTA|nr:hypothetical protein RDWZM_009446 [Blomia tropicalis]